MMIRQQTMSDVGTSRKDLSPLDVGTSARGARRRAHVGQVLESEARRSGQGSESCSWKEGGGNAANCPMPSSSLGWGDWAMGCGGCAGLVLELGGLCSARTSSAGGAAFADAE